MSDTTLFRSNHAMVVLRLLYSFARRRGGTERVSDNPFMKPGLEWNHLKPRIWTPREIEIFASHADEMGRWSVGTAVILNERSEEHTSDLQSLMRNSYDVFCLNKINKAH